MAAPSGFSPLEILRVLLDEGVEFLLVGGIAVATYVTDRATADIDIMVPSGDADNQRRLERALRRLSADLVGSQGGHGQPPAPDDPYPTLLFATRHGRLDILYRPDGSARYDDVRARSKTLTVLGERLRVAAVDDLIRMKLAAGRRQDLDDVATLTGRAGDRIDRRTRRIRAEWQLPPGADPGDARALLAGRAAEGDSAAQVWLAGGTLILDAQRADLPERHLRAWIAGLHERLVGAQLAGAGPAVGISEVD